jgi:hypothetical protein
MCVCLPLCTSVLSEDDPTMGFPRSHPHQKCLRNACVSRDATGVTVPAQHPLHQIAAASRQQPGLTGDVRCHYNTTTSCKLLLCMRGAVALLLPHPRQDDSCPTRTTNAACPAPYVPNSRHAQTVTRVLSAALSTPTPAGGSVNRGRGPVGAARLSPRTAPALQQRATTCLRATRDRAKARSCPPKRRM